MAVKSTGGDALTPKQLHETLLAIAKLRMERGSCSIRDLGTLLGLSVHGAANRVRILREMGVILPPVPKRSGSAGDLRTLWHKQNDARVYDRVASSEGKALTGAEAAS